MSATAMAAIKFPPKHRVGFFQTLAGKTVVHLRAKICLVPTYTINKPWRLRYPLPDRAHGIAPRIERHASVDRGTTLELRVD
jgi:hypothetical protein